MSWFSEGVFAAGLFERPFLHLHVGNHVHMCRLNALMTKPYSYRGQIDPCGEHGHGRGVSENVRGYTLALELRIGRYCS